MCLQTWHDVFNIPLTPPKEKKKSGKIYSGGTGSSCLQSNKMVLIFVTETDTKMEVETREADKGRWR